MTEYLADNAWAPLKYTLDERLVRYCDDRYTTDGDKMLSVWRKFMPLASVSHWSRADGDARSELFFNLSRYMRFPSSADVCANIRNEIEAQLPNVPSLLETLASVDVCADEFIRRDAYDIARTVCGRMINLCIIRIVNKFNLWLSGDELDRAEFDGLCTAASELLSVLGDILAGHDDYSMYATLEGLKAVTYVNPCFEETLKNNASCGYCRSYIYENVRYLYQPELELLLSGVRACLDAGDRSAGVFNTYRDKLGEAAQGYYDTPLCDMRMSDVPSFAGALRRLGSIAAKL